MNDTRNTSEAGTAGEDGGLDPQEAATLFEQTRLQARRQFEPAPPPRSSPSCSPLRRSTSAQHWWLPSARPPG
jgi:hypothetical protein